MAKARLIQLVALALCGLTLYWAARFLPGLNDGRKQLNAFGSEDVLASTPPEYAFAIQAFGAFRSLITNIAFIRAEKYKDQGRYFDAMQLASWICQLQPRFPSVWEFHAWNMAWNISVTTFTPEERWNWVYNGVKLLRDQGIPYNPRAINLYKQLAWIFNNKMSEPIDDFHWEYKRYWAWHMHLVLGPHQSLSAEFRPPEEELAEAVDVVEDPILPAARAIAEQHERKRLQRMAEGTPFRTTKTLEQRLKELPQEAGPPGLPLPGEIARRAEIQYLREIATAPRTLSELYRQHPPTREMTARLRELGIVITDDPLTEDRYWYDGRPAQTFLARYRQLVDTPSLARTLRQQEAGTAEADAQATQQLGEILGLARQEPAGQALVRFLQSKVLREVYKLDPDHMISVVDNFGPVDWRVVDAHSLYWVTLGLKRAGETPTSFQSDRVNTARLIFFSLRNLFHRNRLTFEPDPQNIANSYINLAPDMNFIEPMHRAFITYGPLIDPDPGDATGAGSIFRTGHVNFLTEAIRMLYFADRVEEAERYYEYLRTHYGRREGDQAIEKRYTLPLHDFVLTTMYGSIENLRETARVVSDLLLRAYDELAEGNFTAYNRYVNKAAELHETFMTEKKDYRGPRMRLPAFGSMQVDIFREWLAAPAYHPHMLITKARLWRNAPPGLKQWVYDDLLPILTRECEHWKFDVGRAFPEPPDMAAFRERHPAREAGRPEPTAETPAQPPGGG